MRRLFGFGILATCFLALPNSFAGKLYSPPSLTPNPPLQQGTDPLLGTSWHLSEIGAYRAWEVTKGDRNVAIAIVDSGVDYNHSELSGSIRRNTADCNFNNIDDDHNGYVDDCIGWNFSEEMSMPWDDNGHGTFIAGIVAGAYNNKLGGSGVCPECSIIPLRFLNSDGLGDTEDAIRGIDYAVENGASVISLSFAGEGYDQPLRNVLKKALAKNIVVVVAAGNEGLNNDKNEVYPANFHLPNMITVAASRRDKHLWEGSDYGFRNVTLAAPGTTIWGPWIDGKWYSSQGTSFATPITAAAAGLIRSANPGLSAVEVVEILKATVTPSVALLKKVSTGGILNVGEAMACAMDASLPCLKDRKKKP